MTKLVVKMTDSYLIKANNGDAAQKVYEALSVDGLEPARKMADELDVIVEWVNHTDSVDYEEV